MLGNGKSKFFSVDAENITVNRRNKSQKRMKLEAATFLNNKQDDIENLKNGITQLKNLSLDINELVNNQEEMVNVAATSTELSKEDIAQADENIQDAKKHHRHCGCNVF